METAGKQVVGEQSREIIAVFVRKGPEPDSRLLSFKIPGSFDLEPKDVFAAGLAFDGNSLSVVVTPRTSVVRFWDETPEGIALRGISLGQGRGDDGREERTLTEALRQVQSALYEWLTVKGASVVFA